MAVMEHPYYASFGYQVSNFFAPSSRFGTPKELKKLIDKAHELDIAVILDIVHSHAVSNEKEGLALFDGTNSLYFHPDPKGHHPVWDSRCFDYGKLEVLSFLLSNVKYWMEEFHFDGLRFDGVTSMTYWNHGIGVDFVNYSQYFDDNVDEDALVYLALANKVMHQVNPNSISIAEDVSGMPCLSYPVEEGGIGFDYRMSMGIADFWKKTIVSKRDEEWNVNEIYFRLTDKRPEERTISYAESHDQAMVGDKPILFSLVDKDIYFSMAVNTNNMVIDRGIALHKLIRFLTLTLANGGYLNFMGNEFGHPEWIDFPRDGNQWSYQYALRRWDLADDEALKYHYLQNFDEALVHCATENNILEHSPIKLYEHLKDQLLCFGRGSEIFIVNLHPTKSFTDYAFPVSDEGKYTIILNSDALNFGGFGNIDDSIKHSTSFFKGVHHLKLYCPSRTAMILKKI
jgi:1,4-alpha-glucan branching enzyme